ncbi:MAG: preprotein translocase subunit SecE [Neisseriaceae bacterium]
MKQKKSVRTKKVPSIDARVTSERPLSKNGRSRLKAQRGAKLGLGASKERQVSTGDKLKLSLSTLLLILSIAGFYFFRSPNFLYSSGSMVLAYASPLLGIVLFLVTVFYWCSFGFNLVTYVRDATVELKKVVWPERKTAGRMTLVVLAFVAILALSMWLADSFIQWVLYDIILKRGS